MPASPPPPPPPRMPELGNLPGTVEDGKRPRAPASAAETSSRIMRRTSSRDTEPFEEPPASLVSVDDPGCAVGGGGDSLGLHRRIEMLQELPWEPALPSLPACCWCQIVCATWPDVAAHALRSFWTAHAHSGYRPHHSACHTRTSSINYVLLALNSIVWKSLHLWSVYYG